MKERDKEHARERPMRSYVIADSPKPEMSVAFRPENCAGM